MNLRYTLTSAAIVAALAASGVAAGPGFAHTVTGSATCERADFSARDFDAGLFPPAPASPIPGATLRVELSVMYADHSRDFSRVITGDVYGSANYFAQLGIRGDAVIDAWASWTGRDGNNQSGLRVIRSTFVSCKDDAPTPAPEPKPGEEIPGEPAATIPATTKPADGVKRPSAGRPPVKAKPKPKRVRVFTSCRLRGRVISWPSRPKLVRAHRAADGRFYPVTPANGPCGPVAGNG